MPSDQPATEISCHYTPAAMPSCRSASQPPGGRARRLRARTAASTSGGAVYQRKVCFPCWWPVTETTLAASRTEKRLFIFFGSSLSFAQVSTFEIPSSPAGCRLLLGAHTCAGRSGACCELRNQGSQIDQHTCMCVKEDEDDTALILHPETIVALCNKLEARLWIAQEEGCPHKTSSAGALGTLLLRHQRPGDSIF